MSLEQESQNRLILPSNRDASGDDFVLKGDQLQAPPFSEFPSPIIPTNPILSWDSLRHRQLARIPSILDAAGIDALFVTSGRMALALALKVIGISAGDVVLLPAYHCMSMVEPVAWSGACCDFYRICPDGSIDLEDIQSRLRSNTRLLVVAHYFGFPQPSKMIRDFCDRHGLVMIEDCAHAFFGEQDGQPLGFYGDYAIFSLMKFFPVFDGGCLTSTRHSLRRIHLGSAGMAFQFKTVLNTLEKAFVYRRLDVLRLLLALPFWLKDRLWRWLKSRQESGSEVRRSSPSASEGGFGFDAWWVDKHMSLFSRMTFDLTSRQRNVERRRSHFLRMLEAFDGLQGCAAVHKGLPEDVVPYVFPLRVDHPDPLFWNLRRSAAPVLRWEQLAPGVDASIYPVSVDYSRHLIQIPCHQELTDQEVEWMIDVIQQEIRA